MMIGTAIQPIVALLISAVAHAGITDSISLRLKSAVVPAEVSIGQPLQVSVTFQNASEESILLLARDVNFVVEVESRTGVEAITSPRFTAIKPPFKDDEVPLRPGDSYGRVLPIPLNDLSIAPGEGWMAAPGRYRIRVKYDAARSTRTSDAEIWQGTATSGWTEIVVRAPDSEELRRRLRQLDQCARTQDCDTLTLANFYRVVQDERAAGLLMGILRQNPHAVWLLDAIVFQSRAGDAKPLREIAASLQDDATRQQFIEAASKLERRARPKL